MPPAGNRLAAQAALQRLREGSGFSVLREDTMPCSYSQSAKHLINCGNLKGKLMNGGILEIIAACTVNGAEASSRFDPQAKVSGPPAVPCHRPLPFAGLQKDVLVCAYGR